MDENLAVKKRVFRDVFGDMKYFFGSNAPVPEVDVYGDGTDPAARHKVAGILPSSYSSATKRVFINTDGSFQSLLTHAHEATHAINDYENPIGNEMKRAEFIAQVGEEIFAAETGCLKIPTENVAAINKELYMAESLLHAGKRKAERVSDVFSLVGYLKALAEHNYWKNMTPKNEKEAATKRSMDRYHFNLEDMKNFAESESKRMAENLVDTSVESTPRGKLTYREIKEWKQDQEDHSWQIYAHLMFPVIKDDKRILKRTQAEIEHLYVEPFEIPEIMMGSIDLSEEKISAAREEARRRLQALGETDFIPVETRTVAEAIA